RQTAGETLRRTPLGAMFHDEHGKTPAGIGDNVIYAKLVPTADSELLILLNTELLPLDSTVGTLRVQLLIISGILFAAAVAMALIFSARLSKPIREMSGEASKLALGNYNVNFDGGNCTETVMLSSTLNRAAYELSKLDKMQKDLIANVSHDLRTPLTMIAGYTEAMRDLPGEATPENMQIVIDETNRLTSLVNDMLEVSRYQGGTQVLHPARFNFTEVIRTTLERYGKLREKDGYTIRFEADRDVFVEADEGRILQVVYNLINNAVNYTGEDKTVVIRQTVLNEGGEAKVLAEVIDTGIGISDEDLPLVWERYYKVNDFHKRANMGTGLGLSIVKNILLLHGAEFGVNSKVGHGSNFWFKLKICE
ncbi:MAG: two-component sensor histidine kinase, partial [Clostridia bacterium]|nr:two-component sensor histidine kinase [Clostridia bacterium]